MCIYIYVYICRSIYVYIYIYENMYIYIYTYIDTYIHMCMWFILHMCGHRALQNTCLYISNYTCLHSAGFSKVYNLTQFLKTSG